MVIHLLSSPLPLSLFCFFPTLIPTRTTLNIALFQLITALQSTDHVSHSYSIYANNLAANMTMNGTNGHTNGHTTVIKSSNEPDGVLEALGLTGQLNEGLVSDAQVKLKGEVVDTYCPSTGKVLAQVQTVSIHPVSQAILQAAELRILAGPPIRRSRPRGFSSRRLPQVATRPSA